MKKLLLAAVALLLSVGALSAQDSRKWYVLGAIMGDYQTINTSLVGGSGFDTWSVGAGISINRMLGEKFSAGIGVSYVGGQELDSYWDTHLLGVELGFAYFGKIVDKLYYVPEVSIGMAFDVSKYADGDNIFLAGISPFGLEFRPGCEKIGLRLNIVSLTYARRPSINQFTVSANPTFSVNFRF